MPSWHGTYFAQGHPYLSYTGSRIVGYFVDEFKTNMNIPIVLHQQGFSGVKDEEMEAVMGKDDGTSLEDMDGDRLVYYFERYSRM
jgi:hypothetical protein